MGDWRYKPNTGADSGARQRILLRSLVLLLALSLSLASTARAQEAVRASLAGAAAAEARHKAASTIGYYNIEVGDTEWSFSSRLQAEYNDNVGLNGGGQTGGTVGKAESDIIFRPELDTRMFWPVSEKHSLNLAIGAGYSAYVQHSRFDRLFITPGSELAFDIYTGDFWINVHDRFSINESSSQDPTVANTGNFSQFQNASGLGISWDLNKVIVRFGYDHNISLPVTGSGGQGQIQTGSESDIGSLSAGYAIGGGMLAGIESGGGVIRNGSSGSTTNSVSRDNFQWNVGAFMELKVSDYISLTAGAGITETGPLNAGQAAGNLRSEPGVYGHLDLNHRVNRLLTYSLSGGRLVSSGYAAGTVDLYFAHLTASWKLFQKTSVNTMFSYDKGSSAGTSAESFDRLGGGVQLGRVLTQKLTGGLGYNIFSRNSSEAGRSYVENRVDLDLTYKF